MTSPPDAMALGWSYFQAGRLAEAEQVFRQLLEAHPDAADAWFMLGVVCRGRGDLAAAADAYRRVLDLRPDYPEALNNLGNVLVLAGRSDEAVGHYRRLLQLRPDYPEGHNNLGVALRNLGRPEEAVPSYREALRLKPDYPEAANNLGDALAKLGRWDEAVGSYRQALRAKPGYPEALTNLGVALLRSGKPDEAERHHREALRLRPDYPEALSNLGNTLAARGQVEDAVAAYRRAIDVRPGYAEAHYNLGVALAEAGRLDEAVASYREAIRLRPEYPAAVGNLGHALRAAGDHDGAMACYQRLLALQPDDPDAHLARALTWLLLGDYERGWPEYEWRWRSKEFAPPPHPQPRWDGSPLAGRTVLLHAEQGLGDTLQYARYAALVKERGGTVLLECQPPLARLIATVPGVDRVVPRGEPPPPFDVQAPLLSLPAILKTTLATVPANVPYLSPDPALVAHWRGELARHPGFKVGICWQGNPKYKADRYRSFPLAAAAPLARVPGVRLVSLQKGPGTEQLDRLRDELGVLDLGPRLDEANGPFADTAAVVACLDLVVAPDTAVAHLAGALGAPVWVALPTAAHFCWLLGRDDSPWYPTARLFRQERAGDWGGVFARMADALRERVPPPSAAIAIPVSPGELLDRITILRIKSERIADPAKLRNVRAELEALVEIQAWAVPASPELDRLADELWAANDAIWRAEDEVRLCERAGDFGERFVASARAVYHNNDRRAAAKRRVNDLLGFALQEEKGYPDYPGGALSAGSGAGN